MTRRFVLFGALALTLSACYGTGGLYGNGGSGGLYGSQCYPGTQVQLANPTPLQSNVNPNIGSITIVANGNNNALYSNYSAFSITLFDQYGDQIYGGFLRLVSYPNGPHPYTSDFYYQSSIVPLQYGTIYTAELVGSGFGSNCITQLQSFST